MDGAQIAFFQKLIAERKDGANISELGNLLHCLVQTTENVYDMTFRTYHCYVENCRSFWYCP